jgi:PAS domain S-box-containing protein
MTPSSPHAKSLAAIVGALALATVVRALLTPALQDSVPFITYFPAVAAAAWFGVLPGITALAVSYLLADFFFLPPIYGFTLLSWTAKSAAEFLTFLVMGGLIIALMQAYRRAHERSKSEVLEAARRGDVLRITLASIGDGVIATDREGRVSFMNAVAEALTGFTQQEAEGRPLTDVFRIINEQTRQALENPTEKVLRTGAIVGLANHTVLISRDGRERPVHDSAAPIFDAQGAVQGVVLVFMDATQERESQRALQMLAAIVEHSDDAIIGKDMQRRITSWNAGAERLYGYTAQEAIGQSIDLIVPENHRDELTTIMQRLKRGEMIDHWDTVRRRRDGSLVDVSLRISPIKNSHGEVVGASKVARDITERKRAEKSKDEFLAMLAHELRNPLAAISYAAAAARLPGAGASDEMLELIERQVKNLSRLIDDLLDISRISREKIQLRREIVDASIIVRRAAATMQPLVAEKRHVLEVDVSKEPMPVNVDPTRAEQIVGNLLANAAKYTPDGGRVVLRAFPERGEAVIQVQDTGIGISREMLPSVFELFAQADRTLDRSQGGLGIGLTVVRKLTEMHGGSVGAYSPGVGLGSTFTARLPLSEPVKAMVNGETPRRGAQQPKLRVLVVEDNRDTAKVQALLLKQFGHEVAVVHDGQAALEMALEFRPHAVLLDIGLPVLNGYEVASKLREQGFVAESLIAVSGYGQIEDRERSRRAGFNHHLVKPVNHEELISILQSIQPHDAAST